MHVPGTISELIELAVSMQINAPKFVDTTGYLPFLNLNYVFKQLQEGLAQNRQRLGDERYQELLQMSDRMRALFEADPDDKTGETLEGCRILHEMEDILRLVRRKR